jgi:Tol biopolymer transport system component/DNA-binding winged helix-turn-helix (wHTH) protein
LLDNPSEVITRDTLCAALWPEDTFVEFERSLNAAIAKLRQTLGDSAENPRFIETVARRGYRFIAPVETIALAESTAGVELQSPSVAEHDPAIVANAPARQPSTTEHHKKLWIVGAALAAVVVAVAITVIPRRHSRTETTPEMTRLTFDSGLTTDPAASPDGKLLAYASDRSGSGRLHIWVQQFMPNGQTMQLTRGDADDHQPAFSPDGSKLAFRSERDGGGIYVIPAIGGEATLIAKGGRDPRFSPDGRWIAYWQEVMMAAPFVAGAGTVYVIPSVGGPSQAVTSDLTVAGVPEWSQDSKRLIVFGRKDDLPPSAGGWNWWVVPVDGGPATSTGAFVRLKAKGFYGTETWEAPRVAKWHSNELLFSARRGDSSNVWKVEIDGSTSRVTGDPQRLTSGTGLDAYPSMTADGRLLFASLINSSDVWILPVDTNSATAVGKPQRVTETVGPHHFASLSTDGRLLAYSSVRYGHPRGWIKNLESGTATPLASGAASQYVSQLSSDGSLLVYTTGGENGAGFVVPVRGGASDQFCDHCATAYDLSPDNKVVLYRKGNTIRAFNLVSRRESLFMQSTKYHIYQHKFSPDGEWVTFEALHGTRSRLFVAALRDNGLPAPENEWIPLTVDEGWADKPRWSPDGNVIYFISNRDGFFCLWAQRVDKSKHPSGAPASIAHFHGSRLSIGNVGSGGVIEISVARDKIAMNLGELTGNIWVTNLPY